jgi:1,4-alpha-glucan branching enzyme
MRFEAELQADRAVRFRLWAPQHPEAAVEFDGKVITMEPVGAGWHEVVTKSARRNAVSLQIARRAAGAGPGVTLPAAGRARSEQGGRSGCLSLAWARWTGRPWEEAVIYELHIGAFTPKGTFQRAIGKLDQLIELDITAIEIMPIGDFPGLRNWGCDGVLPYAPDSSYGRPEALRQMTAAPHDRAGRIKAAATETEKPTKDVSYSPGAAD